MYQERSYRGAVSAGGLVSFTVVVKETDLFVLASKDLSDAVRESVMRHRHGLETYIGMRPEFLRSLVPVEVEPAAPELVRRMAEAAKAAGVGPMAAVAGAIAELVGEELVAQSEDVIVENGGDIFIRTSVPRLVAIYAGTSPLSGKVAIRVRPEDTPVGVCTSSGTVGHSLSMGSSDAVCIVSASAALADAAATAVGNVVGGEADIEGALAFAGGIKGVLGAVVITGGRLGAWGAVELARP